jgi:hypothetical protein
MSRGRLGNSRIGSAVDPQCEDRTSAIRSHTLCVFHTGCSSVNSLRMAWMVFKTVEQTLAWD